MSGYCFNNHRSAELEYIHGISSKQTLDDYVDKCYHKYDMSM